MLIKRLCSGIVSLSLIIGALYFSSAFYKSTAQSADNTKLRLLAPLGHTGAINALAYSPDGRILASAGSDATIKLWSSDSGYVLNTLRGHTYSVESLDFSPDGKILATAGSDNYIILWDVASGKQTRKFTGHTGAVSAVKFSPDGRSLASGSWDNTIKFWDVADGRVIKTFSRNEGEILAFDFSPDGKTFATSVGTGLVKVWNFESGSVIYRLKFDDFVFSLAFSPDGKRLVTGVFDGTVKIFDVETGKELMSLSGATGANAETAFSPDGKIIAAADNRNSINLWETATGKQLKKIEIQSSYGAGDADFQTKQFQRQSGSQTKLNSLVFSPDGQRLTGAGNDGRINFWDISSGILTKTFSVQNASPASLAVSPDNSNLAAGSLDNTIKLWDLKNGRISRSLTGHTNTVTGVAFSPDGKLLASGSADNTIRLWDVENGLEVKIFRGHTAQINSLEFSADGKKLTSRAADAAIKIWDVSTGEASDLQFKNREKDPNASYVLPVESVVSSDKKLNFEIVESEIKISDAKTGKQLLNLVALGEKDWAAYTPEGLYDASPNAERMLAFAFHSEIIAAEQLKNLLYIPGVLVKIANNEPMPAVNLDNFRLYPKIEIKSLTDKIAKFEIQLTNQGGGIGRTQVFVNGKEYLADARPKNFDANTQQTTLTVDLTNSPVLSNQQNVITVRAFNDQGWLSNNVQINWNPTGTTVGNNVESPNFYAIVAGISDYAGDALDLNFPANDAAAVAKAFEIGAKKLFGTDKVHIRLLTSEGDKTQVKFDVPDAKISTATKEDFKRTFFEFSKATPNDVFIIYLSGHGVSMNLAGSETYLYPTQEAITTDKSVLSDKQTREAMTVSGDELKELVKTNKALKQVLILDTSAAGALSNSLILKKDLPSDQIRAIERLKDTTGLFILMGSTADAVSYEASQYGQGLLTYSLLLGMKGAALDVNGFIDIQRLFNYVVDTVPTLAANIGGIQRPYFIMPDTARGFVIGQMTPSEQKGIELSSPKPIILRPLFINKEKNFDDLEFSRTMANELRKQSYLKQNGDSKLVFVDTDELADAIRPSGIYTIDGKDITLKLSLTKNQTVISTLELYGSTDDLEAFAKLVTNVIIKTAHNPGQKRAANRTKESEVKTTNLNDGGFIKTAFGQNAGANFRKISFVTTDELKNRNYGLSNLQTEKPVVILPLIENAKSGVGDDLELKPEIVKVLETHSNQTDGKFVFKNVGEEANALRFRGVYEKQGEEDFSLRITVLLNEREISPETEIYMTGFDKAQVSRLFLKKAIELLIKLPKLKGSRPVLTAEEQKLLERQVESYALLIATNDYDELDDLNNPICDAKTVGEELRLNFGYKKENIKEVFNQNYDGVISSIQSYHTMTYPQDVDRQLFVFISGHGVYSPERKRGWLAVKDSKVAEINLDRSYIGFEGLAQDIANLPFKHIFVVIDSCHSGAFIESEIKSMSKRDADAINRILKIPTRRVITSTSEKYVVSDGVPGEHSPFARSFLSALRTYGGESIFLTIDDIYSRGEMKLLNPIPIRGKMKGDGVSSDFIFIRHSDGASVECQSVCQCPRS